jgi:hypothetical protein
MQIKNYVFRKLEALNPPADMGVKVGGGASDATSQLTTNIF